MDSSRHTHRVRAGIIPFGYNDQDEVVFLFGREIFGRWAPLAGTVEPSEDIVEAAIREFVEESMGLFHRDDLINDMASARHIVIEDRTATSHYYLVPTSWDPRLPIYFSNVTRLMLSCTGGKTNRWNVPSLGTCQEGLFEKSKISWFTLRELSTMTPTQKKDVFNVRGIAIVNHLLRLHWN